MKIISNIFSLVLLLALFASCGKDNYEAPESTLMGTVTYQGKALQLRGTGEAVQLQLYQDGYELDDPISVYVGQDGKFAAKLFDGEYKLITRDGNGPWVNTRDTVVVNLKGTTEVQLEVTPYFLISNAQMSVSGTGVEPGAVTLSADITNSEDVANAKALYARVGVLAKGADQAIYSEVVRLR